MQRRRWRGTVRWVGLVVAVACVAVLLLSHWVEELTGVDRQLRQRFARVRIGMHIDEVIALLGTHDDYSTEFSLAQRRGFEEAYNRASTSRSRYYLFWKTGLDVVYAVGFDENDRVTLTEAGGT
jgi:hypothetical protein